jgi:hypothetical protein
MSVRADLNASNRNNFFELFGFDFLVDEDWRTWLIECNTNPYLGIPNDFIRNLMPIMVDDMLNIILKDKFPPDNKNRQNVERQNVQTKPESKNSDIKTDDKTDDKTDGKEDVKTDVKKDGKKDSKKDGKKESKKEEKTNEKTDAKSKTSEKRKNDFKLLYRYTAMPDEKICKCKNKDKCVCRKIWGMGDKSFKIRKRKRKEKLLIKENVNLRRPFNTSLYPFP